MFELKIVKNTLPYIKPYSILATIILGNNGSYETVSNIIGHYKNKATAEKAKSNFENLLQNGITSKELEDYIHWPSNKRTSLDSNGILHNKIASQTINYFQERLKNKEGDQPPKLPPSKKRKIILD